MVKIRNPQSEIRSKKDIYFMRLAIQEAKKGLGRTSPNPVVGAVLVHEGRVMAQGFHSRFGGPHAEVVALQKVKKVPPGSTLYVTLEPCSTQGKTPPCTDLILDSGIRKVVIGSLDPNPIHHGRSLGLLKARGVKVASGVLEEEIRELNLPFEKWITKKIPYCIVKSALSMDGKIATSTGESKWITEPIARRYAYRLRARVDAVMVGINTVLQDDPSLTCHGVSPKDPLKVVMDSQCRMPLDSKLVKHHAKSLVVVTTLRANVGRVKKLLEKGAKVIQTRPRKNRVDLKEVFLKLGGMGVSAILIEGGGELITSIFQERLADYLYFFYAPILIGGRLAPTSFEGEGFLKLSDAISAKETRIRKLGNDFLIEGKVSYKNQRLKIKNQN